MSFKLIICVYACVTIEKYKKEVEKINKTWANTAGSSVKVLFFLGEQKHAEFTDEKYIYLPGIGNDYLSASYKQSLGLKYIHENYKTDFVLCCGTDTFLNLPLILRYIKKFDPNDNLYIGGHGCVRKIFNVPYYFHSGGPGFIITKNCLEKIYPYCDSMTDNWLDICKRSNIYESLHPACDVAISYFLQTLTFSQIVKADEGLFSHCNYLGYPCHRGRTDMDKILSCHCMTPQNFDDFYNILLENQFFILN